MYNVRISQSVALIAALLFSMVGNAAEAGLQSAIEAVWDQLEASNPVRDFVPPFVGANPLPNCVGAGCPVDPVRWSFAATLVYNRNTGNLSAEIPAAVLDDGAPPTPNYEKIYTLDSLAIDSRLLPYEKTNLASTIFGWQQPFGPLETIDMSPSVLRSEAQLVWAPNGLIFPGFWPPAVRPAAAVIDFGFPLLPGLVQADFAALGFGDPATNYVEYFNHRGIVTLHVPLSLEIVPEPDSVIQVILAIIIVWCSRLRRLSMASDGC
jgi:hypothetical protein